MNFRRDFQIAVSIVAALGTFVTMGYLIVRNENNIKTMNIACEELKEGKLSTKEFRTKYPDMVLELIPEHKAYLGDKDVTIPARTEIYSATGPLPKQITLENGNCVRK